MLRVVKPLLRERVVEPSGQSQWFFRTGGNT